MNCIHCGNPLPDEAKFCPVCGASVIAAPVQEEPPLVEGVPVEEPASAVPAAPVTESTSSGGWYQSAEPQPQPTPAAPVYAKPPIGKITDFYRQAFDVLRQKPVRLWGISLLYLVIACLIAALGSFVPIISLPIVLVLSLGYYSVILDGLHGREVRSEQLFCGFRKNEVLRNAGGLCWMELWTLIWGFVPVMNIIKAYSYCLTPFILLKDKEIGATDALRKSMRMTDGYKGKMFGADILLILAVWLVMFVLALLVELPHIGWLFGIVLFLVYLAAILFLPLFMGLVHGAIFEAIDAVHEEK